MNEQAFFRVFDLFRRSGLTHKASASMILLLLVWMRRASSASGTGFDLSPQQLAKALEAIAAEHPVLTQEFIDNRRLPDLNPVDLTLAVDLLRRLSDSADGKTLTNDLVALPAALEVDLASDASLAFLVSRLLAPRPGELVYVPWDATGQFGAALAGLGARVVIDTPESPVAAVLIGMLHGEPWQVNQTNPLLSQEKPDRFDPDSIYNAAAALLPLGMRLDPDRLERFSRGGFSERTNSAAVLGIRQLLAVTRGRIVVAVQNNLLFSSGAEHNLRQDLLRGGLLRAVIAMPPGLLHYTQVAFCILAIDAKGGSDRVRFVNADSPRFKNSISRNRTALVNIDDLAQMAAGELEGPDTVSVPVERLLDNDAQLQVNRYVLPERVAQARSLLASAKTVALEDLATFIRPPRTTGERDQMQGEDSVDESVLSAFEIGAADLPEFSYIVNPGRSVTIDARGLADEQLLQPNDIVLIVKGSVGKIGIVPPTSEDEAKARRWIAGQSAFVLRVRDKQRIDPRALFMQLRSPLGQELLKGIVSGATIQLIQLRELRRLPVIVPETDLEKKAIQALEGEAVAEEQIAKLRREQARFTEDLWQLS